MDDFHTFLNNHKFETSNQWLRKFSNILYYLMKDYKLLSFSILRNTPLSFLRTPRNLTILDHFWTFDLNGNEKGHCFKYFETILNTDKIHRLTDYPRHEASQQWGSRCSSPPFHGSSSASGPPTRWSNLLFNMVWYVGHCVTFCH